MSIIEGIIRGILSIFLLLIAVIFLGGLYNGLTSNHNNDVISQKSQGGERKGESEAPGISAGKTLEQTVANGRWIYRPNPLPLHSGTIGMNNPIMDSPDLIFKVSNFFFLWFQWCDFLPGPPFKPQISIEITLPRRMVEEKDQKATLRFANGAALDIPKAFTSDERVDFNSGVKQRFEIGKMISVSKPTDLTVGRNHVHLLGLNSEYSIKEFQHAISPRTNLNLYVLESKFLPLRLWPWEKASDYADPSE